MATSRPRAEPPDRVDRAVTGIRSAVGRLVGLLGDEDEAVVGKALAALEEVGPFAVGPLASALPRAPSSRHRAAILGVLTYFGPRAEVQVERALFLTSENDPDPRLRAAAGAALTAVLIARLKQGRRSSPEVDPGCAHGEHPGDASFMDFSG